MQTAIIASTKNTSFDYHLEGLRGLAALLVVLSHVLTNNFHLDPAFRFASIWQYTPPGKLCVLIFFILSGYVIGLTNKKPIITNDQRRLYLKKRLVRLYPLYLIAIVLAISVGVLANTHYALERIGLHLLFGQIALTDVLTTNEPLWSLSFEMFYYLLFLVLSAYQWQPTVTIVVCLVIGVANRFVPSISPLVSAYSYGACFWLIGLLLSRLPKSEQPVQFGRLLALLLLLLSFDRMNIFQSLLAHTPLDYTEQQVPSHFQRPIQFSDFSSLLFCLPLLIHFTNRKIIGLVWFERAAFFTPALYLAGYVASGKIHEPRLFNTLAIAIIFYVVAVGTYLTASYWQIIGKKVLDKLAPLGSISYGIYIIHFPLIILFAQVNTLSGSGFSFLVRLIFFLFIVLLLGTVLEKKFQPWIKAKLMYTRQEVVCESRIVSGQ